MDLKRAVVTGGNAGLGLATATALCARGYEVLISVRSPEKGETALTSVRASVPEAAILYEVMDSTSFASVRDFAARVQTRLGHIDALILNAGVMNVPFALTKDGIESQLQINHLAHFLLTHCLLSCLRGRVVTLASRAHLRWNGPLDLDAHSTADSYDGWACYGRSKTCNILFAKGLALRFPRLRSNALHPGLVDTGLLVAANLAQSTIAQARTVEDGIDTIVYLATSPDVAHVTGEYFADRAVVQPPEISSTASDESQADELWTASEVRCGIEPGTFGLASP